MLGSMNICRFCSNQKDTEKAKDFYVGLLGLRFVKKMTGLPWYWMQTELWCESPKSRRHFTPAPFTILGWQVTAIEQMVKGLQDKGVHFERFGFFEQDQAWDMDRALRRQGGLFKDPDGNTLSRLAHVG